MAIVQNCNVKINTCFDHTRSAKVYQTAAQCDEKQNVLNKVSVFLQHVLY